MKFRNKMKIKKEKINKFKICIFVDTDIAIKHFIKTEAFKEVNAYHDVVYIFNKDDTSKKKATHTDPNTLNLNKIRYTNIPRKRTGEWFPLYIASVIRQQKGLPNYQARMNDIKIERGTKFFWTSQFRSLPLIYQIYKKITINKLKIHSSVLSVIKEEKPDIIIHPSILQGYYINELIQIKDKTGVPLILLMNSWDNPSAKAMCTGLPSKLTVWGEQSYNHAISYLRMPKEKIAILGAAQFQTYRNKIQLGRKELCKIFNVPEDKKIIVYAGAGSGRHETKYLSALNDAIKKNILIDTHIIYRPHPWRGGLGEGEINFLSLNFEHITMDPHMVDYYKTQLLEPNDKVFMIEYEISNQLLTLADALISPLSTMLVEAITKGKPVLVFFPKEYDGKGVGPDKIHFADLIKQKNVITVYKYESFIANIIKLRQYIGQKTIANELKKASQYFHILDKVPFNKKLNKLVHEVYEDEKNF